jgi:homoserine O-acetyltransferase
MGGEMDSVVRFFSIDDFACDSGQIIRPLRIAYTVTGSLNADQSNAVLIFHALTGDQYISGRNPKTGREGWWSSIVGDSAEHAIDTRKYCVICANALGGCMGTTGPGSEDEFGNIYGSRFPAISIRDIVRSQFLLIKALGLRRLHSVIGPSMGGMQALQWCVDYPGSTMTALLIGTTARESARNIAQHEAGRRAIMADAEWHNGNYIDHKTKPTRGLAAARMMAHIGYLARNSLDRRFGRRREVGGRKGFEVVNYLEHQGRSFVERFDANSYIVLTTASDEFDVFCDGFKGVSRIASANLRVGLICFSSDDLEPPLESEYIMEVLLGLGVKVSLLNVETDTGHDSFLMNNSSYKEAIARFLDTGTLRG